MITTWSEVDNFPTEAGPPLLFAQFPCSSAEELQIMLLALPATTIFIVDDGPIVESGDILATRNVLNNQIYFHACQAQHARINNATQFKRR